MQNFCKKGVGWTLRRGLACSGSREVRGRMASSFSSSSKGVRPSLTIETLKACALLGLLLMAAESPCQVEASPLIGEGHMEVWLP